MRKFLIITPLFLSLSCQPKTVSRSEKMNALAEKYVRLGLAIGQYDSDFVDAYYGPDSLKPVAVKQPVFPKDSLLNAVKGFDVGEKNFGNR